MTPHPTRADWWVPPFDGSTIPEGQWARFEHLGKGTVREFRSSFSRVYEAHAHDTARVFIDSRWTPTYEVGDVITESTPETLPAHGTVLIDEGHTAWQIEGRNVSMAGGHPEPWDDFDWLPVTIVYIPTKETP